MKPKWISRKDYAAPFIKAAKDRGIKLSNKNLKRIDGLHCAWASQHGGMNWVFRHCYEEVIVKLVQEPFINPFYKNIPPIDYTKTNQLAFDKYIKN